MADPPLPNTPPNRSPYSSRSDTSRPSSAVGSPIAPRRSRYAEIQPESGVNVVDDEGNNVVADDGHAQIREAILHMHQ